MLPDESDLGSQNQGKDSILAEWITVVNPDLEGAPPTEVTREHFEINLQAKGFVIVGEEPDEEE